MAVLPGAHWGRPSRPNGTGVLVLSGSSGRVEADRADVLATTGALALTHAWFGSAPGPRAINELPLESLQAALDVLERECERIVVFGVSKSAEALLLLATLDPRIDAVVAVAPTTHVWANVGPDAAGDLRPQRSSWSWQGEPWPFVPYDDELEVAGDPPVFTPLYEHSLALTARHDPGRVAAARIPVEQVFGHVLLVAGGDDGVWPSLAAAREIARAREAVDLPTTLVSHPGAGHRMTLPGERPAVGGISMARGGTERADRELGEGAWPHIAATLSL